MADEATAHRWKFFRIGGFDQVRLDDGADLLALDKLDQKLWVALSCPVYGTELDDKTLALIDTDEDGKIRAPEILAAVKWAGSALKDVSVLIKGRPTLPLAAINPETEEGKRLLASAKQLLVNLGKKGAKEVTLEDTADQAKIFAETKFNGDGVLPPGSAEDEGVKKAIEEVIACMGSETDRSGAQGVTQEKVDAFFAEAQAFADWWKIAESDAGNVLPLGEGTVAAAATFHAVKAKVDDYFARCRLVAFDARAEAPLNREQAEYALLAAKDLRSEVAEVQAFPLARVAADRPLPLESGLNPAWSAAIAKLRAEVLHPLLGDSKALSEAQWSALSAKLAAFEAWSGAKAGAKVEALGVARARALLAGKEREAITALIAEDQALEPEATAIASVERLVRYHRDLYTLLNNFVTFRDFYSRKKKGVFQAGTLYLDGRSCELTVKVADAGAHAAVATNSGVFLVYCECKRKGAVEKITIAAAFTGGDSDDLAVGRNGLFYDRKGVDWDATIIKIVEHPISVPQAFWMPYKRVGKLIGEQMDKFASSRDKEMQDKSAAGVTDTAKKAEIAPAAAPPSAFDVGKFAGIFAAIGLAIGAIGSILIAVATGFLSLHWWQMPLALLGVILLISGPSMLIAWLKLRRRNLGPILDANGWAVNARAKINIPFGASLTGVATLPANAERSLKDPFEEKGRPWGLIVFVAAVIAVGAAWKLGYARTWMDELRAPPTAPSAAPSAAPAAAPS
ncbi:MAG: hypothetical protein ABI193_04270 [Minicystis sp.]